MFSRSKVGRFSTHETITPGPGSYDVKQQRMKKNVGVGFKSKSGRFEENKENVPGPGCYAGDSTPRNPLGSLNNSMSSNPTPLKRKPKMVISGALAELKIEEAQEEIKHLRLKVCSLMEEKESAIVELKQKTVQFHELTHAWEQDSNHVESSMMDHAKELKELADKLSHAEEVALESQEALSQLDSALQGESAKWGEETTRLQSQLSTVSEESEKTKAELEEISLRVQSKEGSLASLTKQHQQLQESLEEEKSCVAQLQREMSSLNEENEGLKCQISEKESNVAALTAQLEDSQSTVHRVERDLECDRTKLSEVEKSLVELTEQNEALQQSLNESEQRNRTLQSELDEEGDRAQTLRDNLRDIAASRDDFEFKCREYEARVQQLEEMHSEEQEAASIYRKDTESKLQNLVRCISEAQSANEEERNLRLKEKDDLNGLVEASQRRIETLEASLTEQCQSWEQSTVIKESKIAHLETTVSELRQEVSDGKGQISSQKQRIEAAESALDQKESELVQLQEAHAALGNDMKEKLKTSEAQFAEALQQKSGVETELTARIARNEELEKRLEVTGNCLKAKQDECKEVRSELESVKLASTEHSNSLLETLKEKDGAIDSLTSEKVATSDKLHQVEAILEEQIQNLKKAQAKIDFMTSEKDEMTSKLEAQKSHSQELEGELESVKSHSQELEGELESVKSHSQELEGELESVKSHSQELEGELESVKSHSQELEGELESVKSHSQELESNISELEVRVESTTTSYSSQIAEMSAAHSTELESLTTRLQVVESDLEIEKQLHEGSKNQLLVKLEDMKVQMEQERRKYSDEKASIQTSLHEKTTEMEATSLKLTAVEAEAKQRAEQHSQFVTSLESTIDSLKSTLEKEKSATLELEESLASVKIEVGEKNHLLAEKEQELVDLKAEAEATKKSLEDDLADGLGEKVALMEEISALTASQQELQSSLAAVQEIKSRDMDEMSNKVSQLEASLSSEKEKALQLVAEETHRLHQDFSSQQEQLKASFSEEKQTIIESAVAKEEELEKKLRDEEEATAASKDKVEQLEERHQSMLKERDELRNRVNELASQLSESLDLKEKSLLAQMRRGADSKLQAELDRLRDEKASLKNEASDVMKEVQELRSVNAKLGSHQNSKQKIHYLATVKAENNQLKDDLAALKSQMKKKDRMLKRMQQEIHKHGELTNEVELSDMTKQNAKIQSSLKSLQDLVSTGLQS